MQYVRFRGRSSTPSTLLCGVPQGSVLGPILFLLYTADLIRLVELRGLHPHLFADDTQIYGSCRPEETQTLMDRMSACISDVAEWMQSNRLQLNMTKTELLWCASSRQQHLTPNAPLRVCADDVAPTKYVRDLGIYIDSDMSMKTYVSRTVSSCFAALHHIRSIRRSVCQPVLLSLVTSLVLTRLDYGSVTLNGITKRLMDRLQSLLNAAARLVHNSLNTTAFHHFCATCTGCTSLNASSFVWPFSCSTIATRLHQTTWRDTYSGQTRTTRGDDCDQ